MSSVTMLAHFRSLPTIVARHLGQMASHLCAKDGVKDDDMGYPIDGCTEFFTRAKLLHHQVKAEQLLHSWGALSIRDVLCDGELVEQLEQQLPFKLLEQRRFRNAIYEFSSDLLNDWYFEADHKITCRGICKHQLTYQHSHTVSVGCSSFSPDASNSLGTSSMDNSIKLFAPFARGKTCDGLESFEDDTGSDSMQTSASTPESVPTTPSNRASCTGMPGG